MENNSMETEPGQMSDHQITDKNIASVLQEAISRVAFEHQDAKIDQPESASLENVPTEPRINLCTEGQSQMTSLEQLMLVSSNNQTQIQHEQSDFAHANHVAQDQIQSEQNQSQNIMVNVSESASMFQPEISLHQQEVMSSSYTHVSKPDVFGRRHSAPTVNKKRMEDQATQSDKSDSDAMEQLSRKNERLTSLNIELQEKLLQQIKDTESGAKEIVRISKEVREHAKQIMKLTKRNEKLTTMLEKLRQENSLLKKRKKKPTTRETRSTRRKKVKIKDEEEVVEEEQQSSEDEAPVPDLINDTDDPGFEPELENGDDDDNEIDELIRDMKQEQEDEGKKANDDDESGDKDFNIELPKLDKGSAKKPYSCDMCHASYRTKGFLKAHQKRAHQGAPERRGRRSKRNGNVDDKDDQNESQRKKNKCSYCSAQFQKACHLYRHERQVHKVHSLNRRNKIQYIPGTDKYLVADEETKHLIQSIKQERDEADDEEVNKSNANNTEGDTEQCEEAEEALPNELPSDIEELKKLPQIKVKKGFKCVLCSKVFTQSCHLRRHERVVHRGERFYPCDICKKMFSDRSGLKEHMKVHSDAKEFSCDICNKSYKYSQKLRLHMQTHTGVKPFMCSVCGNTYSTKSYLKEHEVLHTGVKPYACKYCTKTFAQSSALKIHEKIHTGEKNHRCQYCGWAFITVQKMREHEYTHTGEKPCKCKYCPKSFRTGIALKAHERLHTGERPYRCTICGKAFTQHPHLKSHILIHTGERPHKCKHCGKGFMTRGHLASHESVHTGLKPHKCDKCDKSFAKGNHLVRHMRIHTGEKPFICSHCGRGFSRSELLRTHEKQQHGIEHEKRTYPKLITPTKEELTAPDSTMLVPGSEIVQPIADVAMDIGQEVIYQNLPPGQSVMSQHDQHPHPQHPQHPHPQVQNSKVHQAGNMHPQSSSSHVIIPGLGEHLYQESLAKSKQDPSGITVSSLPVEQYWTTAQVTQYMESYPSNQ